MKLSKSFLFLAAAGGMFTFASLPAFADEHNQQHAAHGDAAATDAAATEKKIEAALAKLSPEDRKLAAEQRFCPVMEHSRLGEMGTPVKVLVEGKPVLVCCKGCKAKAVAGGEKTLEKVESLKKATDALAKLPAEDRKAAEAQKYCVVLGDNLLGSMGKPIKIELDGQSVFLCCKGCEKKARANPAETLAKVKELKQAGDDGEHAHADHSSQKGHQE